MKKLTILVDMDDTVECLTDAWLDWLNAAYGRHVTKDDIKSWDFAAAFPGLTEDEAFAPLYIDSFWDTVKPMPWASEILSRLRADGHEIYIVTSSACRTIPAKMERVLFQYFPFINWDHVIIAQKKQMIFGDVLIDDAPHNLEGFDGLKILMTAPHNRSCDAKKKGMFRVDNWHTIYDLVTQYAKICETREIARRMKECRTRKRAREQKE